MNRLIIPTIKMPSWISSVYDTIGQPSFGILSDDMLKDIAGGKVKDTDYIVEGLNVMFINGVAAEGFSTD